MEIQILVFIFIIVLLFNFNIYGILAQNRIVTGTVFNSISGKPVSDIIVSVNDVDESTTSSGMECH